MLPLFSSTVLLLGGLVAAAPYADTEEKCHPRTICVDALSPCGVKYGGCYDVCDPSAKPVPPPCPTTKKPTHHPTCKPPVTKTVDVTVTKTVDVTVTKTVTVCSSKPPVSSTSSKCTATQTVCWDGINECGQWYGGCFPDCKPWPTFSPPPCTKTTSTTTTSKAPPPSSSTTSKCTATQTICADYINECGQMYGGCFPDCKPWPTFTAPPCTKTTTSLSTVTVPPSSKTTSSCNTSRTVCWDGINECGMMYGGCFPDCKPWPTFTAPPCPTTTLKTIY